MKVCGALPRRRYAGDHGLTAHLIGLAPGFLSNIRPVLLFVALIPWLYASTGCSVRRMAVNQLGNALAQSGATFASDEDPELIRQAVPFSLKLVESLLAESPRHPGLLLAATRGFTQYAYAFVQQDADEWEDRDLATATELRRRARQLYLRARDYGMRAMEVRHPGFTTALRDHPQTTVAGLRTRDVPVMYWTSVAWAAAMALGKDDPELVADLPLVDVLIGRALELDEAYGQGALRTFMIVFETVRTSGTGDPLVRASAQFERARQLTGGQLAGPLVSMAENVSVRKQDLAQFQALLRQALAIEPGARPEWRLENLIMQRRARWLLERADQLFLPADPPNSPPK